MTRNRAQTVSLAHLQRMTYRASVETDRQCYHVFEADGFFLLFSFAPNKPNSGHVNAVSEDMVGFVHRAFEGQEAVTTRDVEGKLRGTRHPILTYTAHNVLYALVATGRARLVAKSGNRFLFHVLKRRRRARLD